MCLHSLSGRSVFMDIERIHSMNDLLYQVNSSLKDDENYKNLKTYLEINNVSRYTVYENVGNGELYVWQFIDKLTTNNKDNFEKLSIKLYEYECPNGLKALLIRGAFDYDMIPIPHHAECDNIDANLAVWDTGIRIRMFLCDYSNDKIISIRYFFIPYFIANSVASIYSYNENIVMSDMDDIENDIVDAKNHIQTMSDEELLSCSNFLGCESFSQLLGSITIIS